jgi:hypothetical protein
MQQATILYDAAGNADRAKPNRFQPDRKEVGVVVKTDDNVEYYVNAIEGSVLWNARKGERIWVDGIKPGAEGKRGSAKFVRKLHENEGGTPAATATAPAQTPQPTMTKSERADEYATLAIHAWQKLSEGLALEVIKPTSEDIQKLVATIMISLK